MTTTDSLKPTCTATSHLCAVRCPQPNAPDTHRPQITAVRVETVVRVEGVFMERSFSITRDRSGTLVSGTLDVVMQINDKITAGLMQLADA